MNKQFKFTDKHITSLPPNPRNSKSTESEYSDTQITGLKCLVGKSGNKRFLFRYTYQSKKQSMSLGKFGDINVATARKIAQKHRLTLLEGKNPKSNNDKVLHMTMGEFFKDYYLPMIKKRKKTWIDDLYRWDSILDKRFALLEYRDLTTIDVQKLHIELTETLNKYGKPYAPATCNQVLMLLKSMTRYAKELGVVDKDVSKPVKLYKLNNARERFLNKHEVKRLLDVCKHYSNKTISGYIAILTLTGLRCSEVTHIKVKDVDIRKRIILIPETKNGLPRTVHLTDLMLGFIGRIPLKPDNPYLFASRAKGKPLKSARKTFKKLLIRAQINPDGVCLHTLRHSVASNLVSEGVSLRLVQEQLAHKSIISTQRYAKLTTESMRDTSETLSNLFS